MSRFISEADISQNKQKIQEAWDATRKESDPTEAPEGEAPQLKDSRPLYYKLEEQRMKKQEEYDDAHRLKNMIRGLEDEEVQFLDLVDRTRVEQERKLKQEENSALTEFRKKQLELEAEQTSKLIAASLNSNRKATPKNSQKALLSGAVRKKSDGSPPRKKQKSGNSSGGDQNSSNGARDKEDSSNSKSEGSTNSEGGGSSSSSGAGGGGGGGGNNFPKVIKASGNNLICAGVLPGIGPYSDSSDSSDDSNSSDSDNDVKLGSVITVKRSNNSGGCC